MAEKNAAALVEICEFALGYQHDGKVAGERPHVTVTIALAELEARARGALLDMGGELTPGQLRRMLCDARIVPVVLGERSEPLDVGRAQRTVSDPLRRLVAARDRGCAHPGCDRPPSWCEVHHVIEWRHGGTTSIDNLVMLCGAHHDQIHDTEWTIDMSTGIPQFIAPDWLESLWGATDQPSTTPGRPSCTDHTARVETGAPGCSTKGSTRNELVNRSGVTSTRT